MRGKRGLSKGEWGVYNQTYNQATTKPYGGQVLEEGYVLQVLQLILERRQAQPPTTFPPLHLGAPQDVLLLIHKDREMLVLALLDGVGTCGDGSYFAELYWEDKIRQTKSDDQEVFIACIIKLPLS